MCDYSLHHVKSWSARVGDNGHRDFNSVTSMGRIRARKPLSFDPVNGDDIGCDGANSSTRP
jgi:hypothetical protein